MQCVIWSADEINLKPDEIWRGDITHMPRIGDLIEVKDLLYEVVFVCWFPEKNAVAVRVK